MLGVTIQLGIYLVAKLLVKSCHCRQAGSALKLLKNLIIS